MLLGDAGVRLWLYCQPTDMRKSFDGLAVLAAMSWGKIHWAVWGIRSMPITESGACRSLNPVDADH